MNILFVNDIPFNPLGGGLERVTDILTKELVKRGHNIAYLCGKLSLSQLYLLDYDFPANLYQLPNYDFFDDEENICFYKRLLIELELDIVVNQRGLGGKFNKLLLVTQPKVVSVIHSTPESDVVIFLNRLMELTVPPFVGFKRIIKRMFPTLISLYWKKKAIDMMKNKYNELACHSNVIVTLSPKYINILRQFINVSHQAKIISIPNPNTFDMVGSISKPKEKIVLFVGRLEKEEKEPLRLLKIWKYLHKKYSDWQLIIVGDGDERDRMQYYVNKRGLNNVFFEGRQSNVVQYYQKASFICLTSNFEGWGMVLTEGMQYGCIPFTFDNYGAAFEIIDDGLNGCLISAFDLKEYAFRLSGLMSNCEKRIEMSKEAVKKVKMFSPENVVDKWEKLFQDLIKC